MRPGRRRGFNSCGRAAGAAGVTTAPRGCGRFMGGMKAGPHAAFGGGTAAKLRVVDPWLLLNYMMVLALCFLWIDAGSDELILAPPTGAFARLGRFDHAD